ncbi:MAG: hypothetical protein BGN87_06230 [Rhizobiales bacterium 65-79]|jgi:hypothetical protein|nr:hypothetical protein [Hyphomicrobiales bacterium]OJU02789.1 MAG: hypothetical protein BGN87_06230 [Rhizobiales bacterium 65-79]
MSKPAFTPPHKGGSYRIGKDGKAERVARTVQLSDPAHPIHAARAGAMQPVPPERPAKKED